MKESLQILRCLCFLKTGFPSQDVWLLLFSVRDLKKKRFLLDRHKD